MLDYVICGITGFKLGYITGYWTTQFKSLGFELSQYKDQFCAVKLSKFGCYFCKAGCCLY